MIHDNGPRGRRDVPPPPKGFAVLGVVIVLAVLALLGVGVWAVLELVAWVTTK